MAKKSSAPSGARSNHKKDTASPSARKAPTNVEARAYEIYMKRVSQGKQGSEVSDWLQAESELRADEE